MRQYYEGSIYGLFVNPNGDANYKPLEEHVTFYQTRFGRWVRADNGTVPYSIEEAHDLYYSDLKECDHSLPSSYFVPFVNEETIRPISITKEEVKQLRKVYQQKVRK